MTTSILSFQYFNPSFSTFLTSASFLFSVLSCNVNTDISPSKGVVKGRVVNSEGKPVANAAIVANSNDYYNKTSTGYTNVEGYYEIQLPNRIAEGSYYTEGTVTVKYHSKNYTLALNNEETRVFSAYDGAVRNFIFHLTGKRNADDDATASPLGGKLEVHHDFNALERKILR